MSRDALALALPHFTSHGVTLHATLGGYHIEETEVRIFTVLLDLRPRRGGDESIVRGLHDIARDVAEHMENYRDVEAAMDGLRSLLEQSTAASVRIILALPEYSAAAEINVRAALASLKSLHPHQLDAVIAIATYTPSWRAVSGIGGLQHFVEPVTNHYLAGAARDLFALLLSLAAPTTLIELDLPEILAHTGPAWSPGFMEYGFFGQAGLVAFHEMLDDTTSTVICPVRGADSLHDLMRLSHQWKNETGHVPLVIGTRGFWVEGQLDEFPADLVILYRSARSED